MFIFGTEELVMGMALHAGTIFDKALEWANND